MNVTFLRMGEDPGKLADRPPMSRVHYDASAEVAAWAGHRLNTTFRKPYFALGILNGRGKLSGAVIYNDWDFRNIEMTIVWPTGLGFRRAAKEVFSFAFDHLDCRRISLTIPERHADTIYHAKKWGWKIEGRKRDYYDDDHAVIMGMTREDCRFL